VAAAPTMLIEVGFDVSSTGGPFFLLAADGATPLTDPQSVFNNTTYRLGGVLYYDVTSRADGVTIQRGRSRELDKFQTGTANIHFQNLDRAFDPYYTSSPYYPDVRPRRQIRITAGGTVVFTGQVESWDVDYQVDGDNTAVASCADAFTLFGGQQLTGYTATSQASGARVTSVLNRPEVNWNASLRSIATGAATLQADVVDDGREVLEYLQTVEASEPGYLFMSKTGSVVFKDRNTAAAVGTAVFSDVASSTAIPYVDLAVTYGTELMYNRVVISILNGTPQTASDATSQNDYGISTLNWNSLLLDTDTNALALANYLVSKYKQPDLRFDSITVELSGLSALQQATVLALELTDLIVATYTPNNIGSAITKNVQILGIRHDVRPDSHKITFGLGSTDRAAFVLAANGATALTYPYSILGSDDGSSGSPLGL